MMHILNICDKVRVKKIVNLIGHLCFNVVLITSEVLVAYFEFLSIMLL